MSLWCGSLALRLRFLSVVLLLCSLPFSARSAASYVLVVVPQFPAPEIQRDWQPLLDRLHATSGIQLKLRHVRSIPEFENEFSRGLPDFVFMNPYHAVMARQSQGYIPLVRASAPLTGILVARRTGPSEKWRSRRQGAGFPRTERIRRIALHACAAAGKLESVSCRAM